MFPLVQRDGGQQRDRFRDAVAAGERGDTLQAIDDEHPEDGGRQNPPQIPHHLRGLLRSWTLGAFSRFDAVFLLLWLAAMFFRICVLAHILRLLWEKFRGRSVCEVSP